jgi:hypothetical protein
MDLELEFLEKKGLELIINKFRSWLIENWTGTRSNFQNWNQNWNQKINFLIFNFLKSPKLEPKPLLFIYLFIYSF